MVVSEDFVKKSVQANNLFLGFNLKENVIAIIILLDVIIIILNILEKHWRDVMSSMCKRTANEAESLYLFTKKLNPVGLTTATKTLYVAACTYFWNEFE